MEKIIQGISLLFSMLAVLFGVGVAHGKNAPITCYIQTYNGRYLTAVGGGGRISDVIHTDAVRMGNWEKFTFIDTGEGNSTFGITTFTGNYLTAVGGGGRISDTIHTDATQFREWERFRLVPLSRGWYALQTVNGHYLTAVGGGGRVSDTIHTDATQVQTWEMFRLNCMR